MEDHEQGNDDTTETHGCCSIGILNTNLRTGVHLVLFVSASFVATLPQLNSCVHMRHDTEQQRTTENPQCPQFRQDRVEQTMLEPVCIMVVLLRAKEHLKVSKGMEE